MNRYGNTNINNTTSIQEQRLGAHEFLETQEALRSKVAEVELYGVLINQADDPHLRDILQNQQRRMLQSHQAMLSTLMSQGLQPQATPHTPQVNTYEQVRIGLNNPTIPVPNPRAKEMSDFSIATVALNLHKAGATMSMNWTLECTQPSLRMMHATCANICQEMAYELFQYLNQVGQYQVPQLADHTMQTMMQAFRPATGTAAYNQFNQQQQQPQYR